ncbi:P-loop containing nucleoside triphosphate hydrolase protein [Coniella lustricola]|uniref:P-loop containing nucleoside triphosphate hydrolase protein n=1 Tax=Coniella lustricola TaxID=2025994 RepID=A0A2T3A3P2_9PEZI|nr:P-loop containing nucleoside triphosphate hydrolase protein [Coniella lustricola]
MSRLEPQGYIPLGCLVYPVAESDSVLSKYQDLCSQGWARFEAGVNDDDHTITITRVHLLADDYANGWISRADQSLRQKKMTLLAELDFSPESWKGTFTQHAPARFPLIPSPARARLAKTSADDAEERAEDVSLLRMFNSIPSPRPNMHAVQDDNARAFMCDLLAGTVDGITTEMYPHQCRSSALMHQKEVQPLRTLDPRLVEVLDQEGIVYFYNPVTGDVLREPRYYDAVRGGILAEQMGAGKTLICLALIAATRYQPAEVPDVYQGSNVTTRPRIGSLIDMAAAAATRYACPWRLYIGPEYDNCVKAIARNPGWYHLPRPESRRVSRRPSKDLPPRKIYLTHATLVVVPANLLKQWLAEISKHTQHLQLYTITAKSASVLPDTQTLGQYDIILCSVQSLESLWKEYRHPEQNGSWSLNCPLGLLQLKRCIVDEGHKLGNVKLSGSRTDLLQALDALHISYRWIVTGTPSQGLFGLEDASANDTRLAVSSAEQERKDLARIGSIAKFYLKARPWSNTIHDHGDSPAEWSVYMMQPKHGWQTRTQRDCLKSTFRALMIRHRLAELDQLLPAVDTKMVKLEGSYQDKLSINLFAMMIIFNAVQSQRTDRDYFFHPTNRKSLLQLVHNLRQASVFGGSFYPNQDIQKSLETAKDFVSKNLSSLGQDDAILLQSAVEFGNLAVRNRLKQAAGLFHEVPIYISHFPEAAGSAWSMDGKDSHKLMCTNWKLMTAAQKALRPFLGSTQDLNTYLNSGSFVAKGDSERNKELQHSQSASMRKGNTTLAGNTKLGQDHVSPRKRQSISMGNEGQLTGIPTPPWETREQSVEIAAALAQTQLISTASAKLSYLVDAITTHQKDEQMIIFYDNDNVAWYLAGLLEMLQVHHLIYAKGITTERRAQYVSTFNHSSKFRVLLMDISQAAFGLDMQSASRVFFISPVLNPQVEAQAIGRVRRISQQKRVTVETLVLKDSLEELIVERKASMTQAEHRSCKTILDDRPIYNWINNVKIVPLPDVDVEDGPAQMAPLKTPQYIFGRGIGRQRLHADEDILLKDPSLATPTKPQPRGSTFDDATKAQANGARATDPTARVRFGHIPNTSTQSLGNGTCQPVSQLRVQSEESMPLAAGSAESSSDNVSSSTICRVSHAPTESRAKKRARFAEDADVAGPSA